MKEKLRFQPGETIVLREMWQGKVWVARPEIVVQDTPELLAFYMPEGAIWKSARSWEGKRLRPADRAQGQWLLNEEIWVGTSRLRLSIPNATYSVLAFWNSGDSNHRAWYINLEEPLQRTAIGFDYVDLILDIMVPPDLSSWHWKDEDEFQEAQELGLISSEKAIAIRAEGEKVVTWLRSGKSPFNGWEKWRPDPSWAVPILPTGWDTL